MKIDCSITKNYIKEIQRMCDYYSNCLEGCPAIEICKKTVRHDSSLETIVQLWSDNHPQKTYLEDLMEKYPNLDLCSDGTPEFCPSKLKYQRTKNCDGLSCIECWDQLIQ